MFISFEFIAEKTGQHKHHLWNKHRNYKYNIGVLCAHYIRFRCCQSICLTHTHRAALEVHNKWDVFFSLIFRLRKTSTNHFAFRINWKLFKTKIQANASKMDSENKETDKRIQSEVDLFKTLQKGKISWKKQYFRSCGTKWTNWNLRVGDEVSHSFPSQFPNLVLFFWFGFSDFSKLVQQRELLDGQLNENKTVLEELNILSSDNQVYFSICPLLNHKCDVSDCFTKNCHHFVRCINYLDLYWWNKISRKADKTLENAWITLKKSWNDAMIK